MDVKKTKSVLKVLRGVGLVDFQQAMVLCELGLGRHTYNDLKLSTGIAGNLRNILNRFEEKGLIRRVPGGAVRVYESKARRRVKLFELTARGLEVVERLGMMAV